MSPVCVGAGDTSGVCRPQFDTDGKACVLVHEPKKNFYIKFLHHPFPVESSLHKDDNIANHFNAGDWRAG